MENTSSCRVCALCKEELARTAYYLHLNDSRGVICSGRKQAKESDCDVESASSDSSFEAMAEGDEESGSSFDFKALL